MTLVEYLEVNKMTQVELAKLTGVPVESINRYINHGGGLILRTKEKGRLMGLTSLSFQYSTRLMRQRKLM